MRINTENYLGEGKKDYFEGWYFRHLGNYPCSFIVGVSKCSSDKHSFIQYIDSHNSYYFRYELDAFSYEKEDMTIRVADNTFSLRGITVHLQNEQTTITSTINYSEVIPFKKSVLCPTAMGFLTYLPLPCNHVVISMSHKMEGKISITNNAQKVSNSPTRETNNELIDLCGYGYIEKDFGTKFPRNYLWLHTSNEDLSIIVAIARPIAFNLRGHICIINYRGKQYNLSLYSGGKVKNLQTTSDTVSFTISRGKTKLAISAKTNDMAQYLLAPDSNGQMSIKIKENLNATFDGKLTIHGDQIDCSITLCAFELVIRPNEKI